MSFVQKNCFHPLKGIAAKLQKRDLDIFEAELSRELTKQLRVCEATEQTWKNFIQDVMLNQN